MRQMYIGGPAPSYSGAPSGHHYLNPEPVFVQEPAPAPPPSGGFGDSLLAEPEYNYLPGGGGQYADPGLISADSSDGSHLGYGEILPGGGMHNELNPNPPMLDSEGVVTGGDSGFGDNLAWYGPEMQEDRTDMPPEGHYTDPNMIRPGTLPSGIAYQLGIKDRDTGGTFYTNAGQFGASLDRRHGFGQGVMYI